MTLARALALGFWPNNLCGTVRLGLRWQTMDNPSTLRRRAARYFENAASSTTPEEAERLKETGRQLELWADELEEKPTSASEMQPSSAVKRTDHNPEL